MTNNPEIVFNGYLKLTSSEKDELVQAINDYIESGTVKKASVLKESASRIVKMDIGPMGDLSCPCCGR